MTEELINMDGIGNAAIYIADKLGITIAQMYEIYVRAQVTMALIQIVMIMIWCIVFIILLTKISKLTNKIFKITDEDKKYHEGSILMAYIITFVVCMFVIAIVLNLLYDPILALMCPEYTGLKLLLKDIINVANALK